MSEKIEIRVDERGQVQVEFTGFAGDACLEEAEKLQKVLLDLGVRVRVEDLSMKSAGQIERELGIDETRREIRAGREER